MIIRSLCFCFILAFSPSSATSEAFSIIEWNGRMVLKMSGPIAEGTASRFSALARHIKPAEHGYPILLLDSPGGSVDEALLLSAALDETPFHTVIPNGAFCASACASIVFIAGRYRTVETFGRFGQHTCSARGVPNQECNDIISQHAVAHGVSYGAVSAFISYTPPEEVVWFAREDVDGWGISKYPGSEAVDFGLSEPRAMEFFFGEVPPGQRKWRLDFWNDGWRAFYRPVSDSEREWQVSQICIENIPSTLFLVVEIYGQKEIIEPELLDVRLSTDVFTIDDTDPEIWQNDHFATAIAVAIPEEKVMSWLTEVESFKFSVALREPYETILVEGILSGSRQNLIFAANHCDEW